MGSMIVKTRFLGLWVEPATFRALAARARRENRTPAELARAFIVEGLGVHVKAGPRAAKVPGGARALRRKMRRAAARKAKTTKATGRRQA
jgi:hypothetical protein